MKRKKDPQLQAASEHARELFSPLGEVRIKPMFGGAGIYLEDTFFALIYEYDIYIKVDDDFAKELKSKGSKPFVWTKPSTGQKIQMAYWTLPQSAIDNPRDASDFAMRSIKIARKKPVNQRKVSRKPRK